MHADTLIAAETLHTGFRERWVSLVPGWGGVTQMLARWLARTDDVEAAALRAFEVIADAGTTMTAAESLASGVLRPTDIIVPDHRHAIARARAVAIATAPTYRPPPPSRLSLASAATRAGMLAITETLNATQCLGEAEVAACHALADLYTSGDADLDEPALMARERAAVVELVKAPAVVERMKIIRATGRRPEDP